MSRPPVPLHITAAVSALLARCLPLRPRTIEEAIERGLITEMDWCEELERQREAFAVGLRRAGEEE